MKEDNCCGHSGQHTFFPELVVVVHQCIIKCVCGIVCHDFNQWFLLSVSIRFMDKPSVEEQLVRGRFQQGE